MFLDNWCVVVVVSDCLFEVSCFRSESEMIISVIYNLIVIS